MDGARIASFAANADPGFEGELDETFRRWYPQFRSEPPVELKAAA
jgi:hypothetical protein